MSRQRTAGSTASNNTANPDRTQSRRKPRTTAEAGTDSRTGSRTKTWTVRLDISEEDEDLTAVRAVLDTGGGTFVSRTTARRNPHDLPDHAIGDEYAAGRALLELGRQLLGEGTADASANAKGETAR
jgi:hypothetical protein